MMASGDFTTREEVDRVYRRRARHYDLSANFYYLIGFRYGAYRRRAIERLGLHRGDTVVEIGCGTGANFGWLEDKVGREGRVIGVDQSEAMLERARRRVLKAAWANVELVHCAAADYVFPARVEGILSTCALTLEPDFDRVIERGARALAAGRRWVVMDLKLPSGALRRLAPLLIFLTRPFAVSLEMAKRHPWESIERHLGTVAVEELYGGFAYIASGEAA